MSSEQEYGIINVPLDPITERAFSAYFLGFTTLHPALGFWYHPFVDFIFIPRFGSNSNALFDFLHEVSHAQLQNGILGMLLQSLQKLPAPIEKMLFGRLREVLDSWQRTSEDHESLYRELFLFGEPRRVPASTLTRLPAALLRNFRDAMVDERFQTRWRVFHVINSRRCAIASRWRLVQEAFATFLSVRLPFQDDDFCHLLLQRATHALYPTLDPDARKELLRTIAPIAAQAEARMQRVKNARSVYTRGFKLLARVGDEYGSTFVAMVAALAASHFPYPQCPVLDAKQAEFDVWVSGILLNPHERLLHLVSDRGLLRPFSGAGVEQEDVPDLMRQLLKSLPGYSTSSTSFGEWAGTNLWGSPFYAQAFDTPPLSLAGDAAQRYCQLFSEDRSHVFTHGPAFIPTLLHEDGSIIQADENVRRAFMSNFVDAYEIDRTTRLLQTLASVCDVPLPGQPT